MKIAASGLEVVGEGLEAGSESTGSEVGDKGLDGGALVAVGAVADLRVGVYAWGIHTSKRGVRDTSTCQASKRTRET